jgi:lipoate-protein ligase A
MWIDDQVMRQCADEQCLRVFVPKQTLAVGGRSNDLAREMNLDACANSGVDAVKRRGGGGAVILYDGCVVVSFGCWVRQPYKNDFYFRLVNQAIINAISKVATLPAMSQRGISDLCIGEKKFCGTSMFRSRNYLLYQASILVRIDQDIITQLLPMPSKQPDYRNERPHKDFLVGLSELDKALTPDVLAKGLEDTLPSELSILLADERISPPEAQIAHILQSVES